MRFLQKDEIIKVDKCSSYNVKSTAHFLLTKIRDVRKLGFCLLNCRGNYQEKIEPDCLGGVNEIFKVAGKWITKIFVDLSAYFRDSVPISGLSSFVYMVAGGRFERPICGL